LVDYYLHARTISLASFAFMKIISLSFVWCVA